MGKTRLTDDQLAASLTRLGVLVPGLKWHGVLIDGRRKARLCAGLGIRFPFRDLESLSETATALFHVEPERAVERFGLARGPLAFAELIGVRRGQVAPYFPRTRAVKGPDCLLTETVSFVIPAALREAIESYAEQRGKTLSDVFRAACMLQLNRQRVQTRYQQRTLEPAPTPAAEPKR